MKYLILIMILIQSTPTAAQSIELLNNINIGNDQPLEFTDKSSLLAEFNKELLITDQSYFTIKLSNLQTITIEKLKIKHRSKNKFSWFGHIQGEPENNVNFAVVDNSISGSIYTNWGVFEIVALGENKIKMIELNTDNFDECEGSLEAPVTPANDFINRESANGPSAATLDVIIFYSNDTLTALGSHASVESTAQASIDNMNTALSNSLLMSGLDEVRLLTTLALDRDESGDSSIELNWLRDDNNVNSLRNLYGADLVSMITATTGCGRGFVMRTPGPGFAGSAFQVTRYNCAVGNLSMAHEFGHNLGLEHNPENSSAWPNNGSYDYSFGHFNDGFYRTVMSYSEPCTTGCSRRMYYSNPDVSFLGLPSGVADLSDNTRSLEQTTLIAADFRNFVEDFIFSNSFE